MAKRLKYTKEILTHMLKSTNVIPSTAAGPDVAPTNNMASSKGAWNK
jgi:hypothetical protein